MIILYSFKCSYPAYIPHGGFNPFDMELIFQTHWHAMQWSYRSVLFKVLIQVDGSLLCDIKKKILPSSLSGIFSKAVYILFST